MSLEIHSSPQRTRNITLDAITTNAVFAIREAPICKIFHIHKFERFTSPTKNPEKKFTAEIAEDAEYHILHLRFSRMRRSGFESVTVKMTQTSCPLPT
jgi:hypothetical protein